ncbi:NAD-dependent protein deacetylase sirtuin-2 [Periplaneta americana]|uniref:NAD-dependent protein deacetylase sirtuin-2 n=1 Tax=Periplaneta americana TaxID=6978 RepID=UPI0037E8BB02
MASSGKDGDKTREEESASGGSVDGSSKSGQHSGEDDGAINMIRRYLAEKLGFYDDDAKEESEEKIKVLPEPTLDAVVELIKEGKAKNIITLAGAGISTSAGIPDFRSPVSGLYNNLEKYNLPDPLAIFEISFFKHNPQPFFTLAKELYPGSFKPTICHYFIKLLEEKGLLLRHFTQNIDTLERVAGVPEAKIVEAHGTFHTSHCLQCKREYGLQWMKERIFEDVVPSCEDCNGIVKPDIVFFGENLPPRFFLYAQKDFAKCDLLIIMGSSLTVQPFASLIDKVPTNCPRLLINREKAGQRDRLMAMLGMSSGMDFDSDKNFRDVLWQGDCDEGCQVLADKLGWGDELRQLVKQEHDRIDREQKEEAARREKKKVSSEEKSDSVKK